MLVERVHTFFEAPLNGTPNLAPFVAPKFAPALERRMLPNRWYYISSVAKQKRPLTRSAASVWPNIWKSGEEPSNCMQCIDEWQTQFQRSRDGRTDAPSGQATTMCTEGMMGDVKWPGEKRRLLSHFSLHLLFGTFPLTENFQRSC